MQETVCLENQLAVTLQSGRLGIVTGERTDAKRIASARYDPTKQSLAVRFWGGGAAAIDTFEGAVS